MEVTDPNNVKIYNLSRGKSLPEWLSDRKKRSLARRDIDIRKRIELLQDFSMPDISNTVKISKDGQYILVTGIYKPRVRCYEVHNLSMKFERCMDAEIIRFEILSDDYSKLVFMQNDRYIEFHAAGGTYHRLRIPKFGRDMKYHYPSCDLYLVAAGSDIYRLNLERGQFLNSLVSEATEVNRICINPVNQLITVGTKEGKVEAWDPRQRKRVGVLDCVFSAVTEHTEVDGFPSITAIENCGALTLGVGTATGQILLYDIRSDKPFLVKDHMYGYPIHDLAFHDEQVLSIDSAVLKIWNRHDGKIFTSVESGDNTLFNNLCHVPGSGLMFMANESPKVHTYYIPQLGPAPRWCSFLDSLTEELEESKTDVVYDDYKFVTKKELEELQLTHLIGTPMLRGYMHGYFMSIRLYNKARQLVQPFSFEEYKKKRIRERIEKERGPRVVDKNLPKVNRELALKLMEDRMIPKKKKSAEEFLNDSRFKAMFENPDFEINTNSEEFRLMNPVLSRFDALKNKKETLKQTFTPVEEEEMEEGKVSSDDSIFSSDDEDKTWIKEVKAQHKAIAREKELEERRAKPKPRMYEFNEGGKFLGTVKDIGPKSSSLTLGERVSDEKTEHIRSFSSGNREMTFTVGKKGTGGMDAKSQLEHKKERRALGRKAPFFKPHSKFKFGRRKK